MYHCVLVHGGNMSIEVIDHGVSSPETAASHYPRLTPEEISSVAKEYQAGHIFGSWQIPDTQADLLPSIFMVLIFLDEIAVKEIQATKAVYCYEHMSKAGPRSINGYPIFMSCRLIHKEDVELILEKTRKIEELLASI